MAAAGTFDDPNIAPRTVRQLAWIAWQTAQGIPPEWQQDESTSESRQIFDAWWWTGINGPLVIVCLEAWRLGAIVKPPTTAPLFLPWWMTIVNAGAASNKT